jgi:hypothetical protein
VALSPKSELASLGLFQSLNDIGRKDEAFTEMRRFLSLSKSDEYNRFLHDVNNSLSEDFAKYLEFTDDASPN